jgi:hypothetical protein
LTTTIKASASRLTDIKENQMSDREIILSELMDVLGEEGCGVSCEEATIFQDDEGWKMMLEGFMEPWKLGTTVEEAKASIREYARMGFGLS